MPDGFVAYFGNPLSMPSVPRSARARPPASNRSGRSASKSSRITCCAPAALNGASRFEAANVARLHFVLPQRMLDQRATLRAAAALDLDHILDVAADLLERFAQRLGRKRLPEQLVEPRQVDVHYRHSGTSSSASRFDL